MFNIDILRLSSDQNFVDNSLLPLVADYSSAVLGVLAQLLIAYAESIRKHRGTLFSQGSHQGPGVSLQHSRRAGMRFYASCETVLDMCADSDLVWQTRLALLRAVRDQALYVVHDDEAELVLRAAGDKTIQMLRSTTFGRTAMHV